MMRYDKKATFIRTLGEAKYNPKTGEYESQIEEESLYVNVTDVGAQTSALVIGNLEEGAKVLRTMHPYNRPFEHVLLGNRKYKLIKRVELKERTSLIVGEI